MAEFKAHSSLWSKHGPLTLRRLGSLPAGVDKSVRGRMELAIGPLGAGKTTWAALRCRQLARATGRTLATTGTGWAEPWTCIDSFEGLFELRDCVVLIDEVHLVLPASKGLLGKDVERASLKWLSMCRKRGVCVVATTQAWTRVATHYRQLVTMAWRCRPDRPGRWHTATGFENLLDGGRQVVPTQFFAPRSANIPTRAVAWMPYAVMGETTPAPVLEDQAVRKPAPRPVLERIGERVELADMSDEDFELWLRRIS